MSEVIMIVERMEDDEFSINENEQQDEGPKYAPGKSMKAVYQQLEEGVKKENKSRKIKKEKGQPKSKKKLKSQQQKQQKGEQSKHRGDPYCKYIRNKALQTRLRQTALEGVLKIMNMISKTQISRQVE